MIFRSLYDLKATQGQAGLLLFVVSPALNTRLRLTASHEGWQSRSNYNILISLKHHQFVLDKTSWMRESSLLTFIFKYIPFKEFLLGINLSKLSDTDLRQFLVSVHFLGIRTGHVWNCRKWHCSSLSSFFRMTLAASWLVFLTGDDTNLLSPCCLLSQRLRQLRCSVPKAFLTAPSFPLPSVPRQVCLPLEEPYHSS